MCLPAGTETGVLGKVFSSGRSVRTTWPAGDGEYSIGGSASGIKPHGLSPVVSAECALLTGKMLSRMGVPTGTQEGPEADGEFPPQSYRAASICSPGPEAK